MQVFSILVAVPFVAALVKALVRLPRHPQSVSLFGLHFKNKVGLAAGFDKDGKYLRALAALGFGFIEVGTVTPRPQRGNPKPRLFRLPHSGALINRMGFNNEGCDALVRRLRSMRKSDIVIGANIGKNKDTPNHAAVDDYTFCFERLFPYVDYFVVNVSSPNTPGLRELQDKAPLKAILQAVHKINMAHDSPKPVLLKIAPDLNNAQLDDIVEIARETGLSGIVATNTTISRANLTEPKERIDSIGAGGLSGRPLFPRSLEIVRYLAKRSRGELPIIAAGGIFSGEDAAAMLRAGASLVQIYTGFIYRGPGIVAEILRGCHK